MGRHAFVSDSSPNPPARYSSPYPGLFGRFWAGPKRGAIFPDNAGKIDRAHLPDRFVDLWGIYEFERPGDIFGLRIAAVCAPGRPIVICIDNSSASIGLVLGGCNTRLGRLPTSVFLDDRRPIFVAELDRASPT